MRPKPLLRTLPGPLALLAWAIALPVYAQDHAALGRAALSRADYPAAAEHLEAASRELEGGDRETLSQVQTDLGIAYLTGLAKPADALRAFVRAADLAANPASAWLWASAAAAQLGDPGESERYKRLALGRRLAPAAPPPPEPVAVAAPPRSAAAAPAPSVPVEKPTPRSTGPREQIIEDSKDIGREGEAKKSEPAPEAKPSGGAFDHFFKRKPVGEPQDPPVTEPPPA